MSDWMNQIHNDIKQQIEKYERGKYTLSDDEVDTIMPKVIEFYNEHPEDGDVYRDGNGIILLIQTPKRINDKDGQPINKLEGYPPYGKEDADKKEWNYMLRNCKFRIYGKVESISIFAKKLDWVKIKGVYNKKAFVKASSLKRSYKKLGAEGKPMNLVSFLKDNDVDDIDEIDVSEYIVYYTVNITQVIT